MAIYFIINLLNKMCEHVVGPKLRKFENLCALGLRSASNPKGAHGQKSMTIRTLKLELLCGESGLGIYVSIQTSQNPSTGIGRYSRLKSSPHHSISPRFQHRRSCILHKAYPAVEDGTPLFYSGQSQWHPWSALMKGESEATAGAPGDKRD